jgi:hypothetical protein
LLAAEPSFCGTVRIELQSILRETFTSRDRRDSRRHPRRHHRIESAGMQHGKRRTFTQPSHLLRQRRLPRPNMNLDLRLNSHDVHRRVRSVVLANRFTGDDYLQGI